MLFSSGEKIWKDSPCIEESEKSRIWECGNATESESDYWHCCSGGGDHHCCILVLQILLDSLLLHWWQFNIYFGLKLLKWTKIKKKTQPVGFAIVTQSVMFWAMWECHSIFSCHSTTDSSAASFSNMRPHVVLHSVTSCGLLEITV